MHQISDLHDKEIMKNASKRNWYAENVFSWLNVTMDKIHKYKILMQVFKADHIYLMCANILQSFRDLTICIANC